jgi:hypothetical protein
VRCLLACFMFGCVLAPQQLSTLATTSWPLFPDPWAVTRHAALQYQLWEAQQQASDGTPRFGGVVLQASAMPGCAHLLSSAINQSQLQGSSHGAVIWATPEALRSLPASMWPDGLQVSGRGSAAAPLHTPAADNTSQRARMSTG